MQIGLIGLGEMGFNFALNLKNKGYEVVAYDINEATRKAIQQKGIRGVKSLMELVENVYSKRVIWLMIPAGNVVDETLNKLQHLLSVGDIIIESGNSNYKDSVIRSQRLEALQIDYLDIGITGGPKGALEGLCATIGGNRFAFNYCAPLFSDIAKKDGYLYCGKSGSGHFVKMVHDSIVNGTLQSIAEGFEVIDNSEYNINIEEVAKHWTHCSDLRTKI